MVKVYNDKERHLAMQRALKFSKLFNESNFDAVMNAVEADPPNKADFTAACKKAKLEDTEVEWLWGYLSNCNKNLWTLVPEAAAVTGW